MQTAITTLMTVGSNKWYRLSDADNLLTQIKSIGETLLVTVDANVVSKRRRSKVFVVSDKTKCAGSDHALRDEFNIFVKNFEEYSQSSEMKRKQKNFENHGKKNAAVSRYMNSNDMSSTDLISQYNQADTSSQNVHNMQPDFSGVQSSGAAGYATAGSNGASASSFATANGSTATAGASATVG